MNDISFSKLPAYLKKELAMHLDCCSDQNWKRLADSLHCPTYQVAAFEKRAHYSKEASPSLIFFDGFCDSLSVRYFIEACHEIKNFTVATILESYLRSNIGSLESLYGNNSDRFVSGLLTRMKDFDNSSEGLCSNFLENNVSLSKGICRNILDVDHKFHKPDIFMNGIVKENTRRSIAISEPFYHASVFITYSPQEKNVNGILNICNFLKKNKVNVSIDTDAKYIGDKPTEDWIREKYESADKIIVVATAMFKASTKLREYWKPCFLYSKKPSIQPDGFHIPLIYSLMLDEHNKFKKEMKINNTFRHKRFVCLLPSESSNKDIPKWLRTYPVYIWPNQYKALLLILEGSFKVQNSI